jgi:hypothetical protein
MTNEPDPSMGEFIPVSMLKPATPLETLEASLLVERIGGQVSLTFRGFAKRSGYQARVAMSEATWREFCQQQLSVPPALPKGGVA